MQIKLPLLIPSRNVFTAYKNDVKVFITKLSSFVAVPSISEGESKEINYVAFQISSCAQAFTFY